MSTRPRLSDLSILNYCYIIMFILWKYIQPFDKNEVIPVLFSFLILFLNIYHDVGLIKIRPFSTHFLWLLYVVIMSAFLGMAPGLLPYFYLSQLFSIIVASVIAYKEFMRDSRTLLRVLTWIMIIYVAIGWGTREVNDSGRMHYEGGNGFPNKMVPFAFIVLLRWARKEINVPIAIFLLAVMIYVAVSCATRKAFTGISLIFVAFIVSYLDFRSARSLWVIVALVMAFFGVRYLMGNTLLGERFERESYTGKSLVKQETIFSDMLGDRTDQYIMGWWEFQKRPLLGMGLTNFRRETGYHAVLHTEYIVQLTECGLVGFMLFMAYFFNLLKRSLNVVRRYDRHVGFVLGGYVGAILFMCFTAWIYNSDMMFVCFGVVAGVSDDYIRRARMAQIAR